MRRLVLSAALVASTAAGGVLAFTPVAHAASVCVSAQVIVNGEDVVNQQNCLPPD